MMIEYDNIINKWIVWVKDKSIMKHEFVSKYKRECKNFIKDNYKTRSKKLVFISNKQNTIYKKVYL